MIEEEAVSTVVLLVEDNIDLNLATIQNRCLKG